VKLVSHEQLFDMLCINCELGHATKRPWLGHSHNGGNGYGMASDTILVTLLTKKIEVTIAPDKYSDLTMCYMSMGKQKVLDTFFCGNLLYLNK
jgi:hypothetical protein